MAGLSAVRESVVWFLNRGVETAGRVQSGLMEVRIRREMERNKSVLAQSAGGVATMDAASSSSLPPAAAAVEAEPDMAASLSAEQVQLFAEENRNMLKHHQDQLGKVKCVNRCRSHQTRAEEQADRTQTGRSRSRWWRSRSCRRRWRRICRCSRRTSTSWCRTRIRARRMSRRAMSSWRGRRSGGRRRAWSFGRRLGCVRFWSPGIWSCSLVLVCTVLYDDEWTSNCLHVQCSRGLNHKVCGSTGLKPQGLGAHDAFPPPRLPCDVWSPPTPSHADDRTPSLEATFSHSD